jgi:hypothetical protein
MSAFFRDLMATPATPPSLLSRYIALNGYAYLIAGAALYAAPSLLLALPGFPPWQGHEEGLISALGMTVAIIGWFYVFGARTQATSFALSTVVDRLALPALLVPLIVSGRIQGTLGWTFAILDPALALGALALWWRERR